MKVYLPDSAPGPETAALAPSPVSLAGKRIAVLDNGKPNAGVVMKRAAETLAARTGAEVSLVTKKGPQGLSANAAIPMAEDIFERLLNEADVVITGAADCGSCTAYSVHDAIELEKAGIPTVLLTTTRFAPIAATLAADSGLAEVRALVLEHPIGGIDAPTLEARADAAAGTVAALLTRAAGGAALAPPPFERSGFEGALAALREQVGADGADLVVVEHDAGAGRLALGLVIPDAHCAECVLSRAALESTATARFAPHGITRVTIDDPRELA